jgi:hypothetical protein
VGANDGGGVFVRCRHRLADRVGTGSMEQSMRRNSQYYRRNIDTLVSNAERRVEVLKIQKQIFAIDTKLRLLAELHPSLRATSTEPSEVHMAPSSDQETTPC